MTIISIVNRLPPAVDGIGDYALNLARQLRQDADINTHFIVSQPAWSGAQDLEGFSISQVNERSSDALLKLLQGQNTVLLHYAPHSHAKKGCPYWLLHALETWRQQTEGAKLTIMFHELYSMGKGVVPWNTDFWLLPFQKQVAARMARLGDRCLTSSDRYAELIRQARQIPSEIIPTLPVPSGVGEPRHVPPLSERQRRLIVFGQGGNKKKAYRSVSQIQEACRTLDIQEIWDIGTGISGAFPTIEGVRMVEAGRLPAEQVSEILANSLAGFLSYDPARLAKSTIFSAYSAHGMIPINTEGTSVLADGLLPNQHYWVPQNLAVSAAEFQAIADHARAWYQSHNLETQAKFFAAQITGQIHDSQHVENNHAISHEPFVERQDRLHPQTIPNGDQ
ncbi:hypothetical protein [Phormidesmis priestleyi]